MWSASRSTDANVSYDSSISVTQSGSTISGNVVGIAVIDTDPGYEPDPNRAGTGTVLGFIPWSSLRF